MLSNTLWFVLILIGLGVALTYYMFHWRKFDEGYEKGEAADPERIARENPPDEWCKSHWKEIESSFPRR
jgi:hypothetical protein